MIGYYQYIDQKECTGLPFTGTGYLINQCIEGAIAKCINNELIISEYDARNCTGNSYTQNYSTTCQNGYQAICSGSFNSQPNSSINLRKNGKNCDGSIENLYFASTNGCIIGDTSSYKLFFLLFK